MILAIDSGFGIDKFSYFKKDSLEYGKNLPVYAEANLEAEDMPLFEGKRYYIGEEALMEDSEKIINVIDYKTHEKFAPLSIWAILKKIKVNPEDIDFIYIGLSLAQKEYAQHFIKRLSKFKVSGKTYDFTNKIKLVPQGVGSKYAIDHFYYNENHKETYGIIDIGQLTVDVATVISGKIRPENAEGTSNEGVIKIIQQIQEYIARNFKEIISIKEAQEVLMSGKYNLFGIHDLSKEIKSFKIDYSKYLVSTLSQRHRNIFKKYPKIYFVGGGSYYIDKNILINESGISKENIIFPENSEFYNSYGGLFLSRNK